MGGPGGGRGVRAAAAPLRPAHGSASRASDPSTTGPCLGRPLAPPLPRLRAAVTATAPPTGLAARWRSSRYGVAWSLEHDRATDEPRSPCVGRSRTQGVLERRLGECPARRLPGARVADAQSGSTRAEVLPVLFHITQSHAPRDCPYGKGGSTSLFDGESKNVNVLGLSLIHI